MSSWFMVFFVFVGVLMIALAIPLMPGRVKPNSWYGFRTTRTLQDPDIWYPVNAYAGKWLLAYGLVVALVGVLLFFAPGLSEDDYAMLMSLILLVGILLVMLFGWRYSRKLYLSRIVHRATMLVCLTRKLPLNLGFAPFTMRKTYD